MEKVSTPTDLLCLTGGAYFDLCIRNMGSLRNVTLKGLAGNSLHTYARQADVLVTIALGSEQQECGNLPTSRRTNRFCGAAQNESPSSVSQGLDSMFNVTAASELVPADWKDDIAALFVGFDDLLHALARRRCLLRQGKRCLAGA